MLKTCFVQVIGLLEERRRLEADLCGLMVAANTSDYQTAMSLVVGGQSGHFLFKVEISFCACKI